MCKRVMGNNLSFKGGGEEKLITMQMVHTNGAMLVEKWQNCLIFALSMIAFAFIGKAHTGFTFQVISAHPSPH